MSPQKRQTARKCRLRLTVLNVPGFGEIKIRALPLSPRVCALVEQGLNPSALLGLIRISLEYDQKPEEVEGLLEGGLIPLVPGGKEDEALIRDVCKAMGMPEEFADNVGKQ